MIRNESRTSHPPGPINFNGATGMTWRHAWQLIFQPLRFMTRTAATCGDLSFFRLFGNRGYLLNHPDLIAQVLIHEADAFEKLPRQLNVIKQVFGNGILVSDGARWKNDRQLLQGAFDTSLMQRSADQSVILTKKMLDQWDLRQPIEMTWEMTRLTAGISSVVLIGEDDPAIINELSDAVVSISDEFSHEMNSLWTLPNWTPFTRHRKKQRTLGFYKDLLDRLIRQRQEASRPGNDFLQFLIDQSGPVRIGDPWIRDQLMTVLIAAYHATSMALVWIFHVLDQHPDVESRVISEISAQPESLTGRSLCQKLPYLKQVVFETLRLYPPAWVLFARRSLKPVRMRGYEIAAGGWFYISPYVTHRSEAFFSDPLTFDPDRFCESRIGEIPKNAWLPFGLGGHKCLGSRMATEQLVLIVATILKTTRLRHRIPDYDPPMDARLVLRPRGKLWMNPEPLGVDHPTVTGKQ